MDWWKGRKKLELMFLHLKKKELYYKENPTEFNYLLTE